MFTQITNKSAELGRKCVSDGIRIIDRRCAFANRRFNDAVKEFSLRARSVFARKLDIVGVFLCDANGFNSTKDYLLRRHGELLLHVKRRSCNERMYAASRSGGNSLAGFSHIGRICSGKRTNRGVANHLGNCAASITSTPRNSSCLAIRSLSCGLMLAPGLCSPSRRVVSKIKSLSLAVVIVLATKIVEI